MAQKSRDILKSFFKNNLKPDENHFADLIDSFVHATEGGNSNNGGSTGTGIVDGVTTDENGNIVFNFVGGTTLSITSNGTIGVVKMPIPYVDSYDNFYFVSEEKGNDVNALPNSYRFYKSIVAASEAARLNYDLTGKKNMVYVLKGTYEEESINREHVDMYFEDGAVVWCEGIDQSIINDKLEPIVNANVYGKGTFVNRNYDSYNDQEGINFRQASSMYIEAKLIDGIQTYNNDEVHFDIENINIIFKIATWLNKSLTFKNCRFLNGLQVSSFRKGGGKEVYENCEFILPEFSINDPKNKTLDILDYKGELIFRIEPEGFTREVNTNQPPIVTTGKTNDQLLKELVDDYINIRTGSWSGVSCISTSEIELVGHSLGDFKLEIRNSKCIIQKENCFGVILSKYKNSDTTEGHVILDNILIIDETVSKDTTALVTGWGALATQQPELLIHGLSHNCGTRQKVLAEGFNEWKITFDTIGNFVPKTGGTFEGDVYVSNSETNYPGVYLGAKGDLKTYHKIPVESNVGTGLSVQSNEETGVVSFQFRTKPQNQSGDQTLQIGYYDNSEYIDTPVASMQMFQPNSLFTIGGWLAQKGSGEGFKEGDKFRVLNGNAEIDGQLRSKELKVTDKIEFENGMHFDKEGNFYLKSTEGSYWSHVLRPDSRQRRFNGGSDYSLQENYVDDNVAFNIEETLDRYKHLNDGAVFFRLTNNRSQIAVGYGDAAYGITGYPGWEINDNFLTPKGYIADFRTKKLRVLDGDAEIGGTVRANEILIDGQQAATQSWVNTALAAVVGANIRTSDDKVDDADKLDGIDSIAFARQEAIPAATLKIGWYTIAVNAGNRASAKFVLRETRSARHGSIHFYAAHNYGNGNVITVLSNSWHSGGGSIRNLRLKDFGTYDGVVLQAYIDTDDAPVSGIILEDIQSSGWTPKAWIPDATDPGDLKDYSKLTSVSAEIDLDKTLGINTSADIYVKGNIVMHHGNDGTGSGFDADKLDGLESTSLLRSDADDTFTGKLAIGSTDSRQAGIYGIYDSKKIGHIWSIGTAYKITDDGTDFGNLYGFGYKHTHNVTGGTMANGHQAVWCQNGKPTAAIGTNIWTAGDISANGTYYYGDSKRIIQFSDTWLRLNPSSEFTAGIYCGTKTLRTDGQFEVGSSGSKFKVDTSGNTTVFGNLSGKSVDKAYSHLYKFGGLHFTWDSDAYGTNAQHSIKSAYGTTMGDSLTMNSYNNIRLNIDSNSNNSNSKFEIGHNTSGTANVVFSVDESGNTVASGNVSAYSDRRLKKAIKPVTDSFLAKIDQLKPSFFQWKDKAKDQTGQLGFIAQEVMELFPQWVHKNKEHYSVSYDKMGAVLAVKGIQELHSEIKELREQLNELKYGVTN